ncbi:ArsA family ATPase [Paraliomyxa miuraensis]|uniref:ArsA family ATPase n=1 Tax=Paraliomyxa miuraensis TaxID=376150 RepID=UPI00225208D9|nr:ArsA-related P-loop ATPase [Paraliomyxa miuraensis]MCX4241452.1 ArsA family ATPase [Paraliomyxa miuraensis]
MPAAAHATSPTTGSELLDHRFLLFTGKGGVGKSTVTAALAIEAATQGRSPLVVELGHRATMRSVFGVDEVGFTPRAVGHGVHAMSVEIDQAVVEYMAQHVPSRRLARAIVGNQVLERLFRAMPAVGEIATVNALHRLEAERDGRGRPRWSPILVDLDATGHALMFLELREVVRHLMGAGPMRRLIDEMADLFADPQRTRLNLVTLPDELPVTETLELHARVASARSVGFGRVFVNRVPRSGLRGHEAMVERLRQAAQQGGDAELRADAELAQRVLAAETEARRQVERLTQGLRRQSADGGGAVPAVVLLPRLTAARMQLEDLRRLGRAALGSTPTEDA